MSQSGQFYAKSVPSERYGTGGTTHEKDRTLQLTEQMLSEVAPGEFP